MRYLRIPLFILILLLADALIGLALRPHYRAVTLPAFESFYTKYVDASNEFELVFVGDSRIEHGINTGLLSKACGCKAGNLGVSGSTMATTYYLLRDYLAQHTPTLVVLEVHWSRLVDQGAGSHLYPLLLEHLATRDQIDYFLHSRDLAFVAEKTLYSYRYRKSLSRFLGGKGLQADLSEAPRGADQFIPTTGALDSNSDVALQTLRLLHPYDLPASDTEVAYLERTITLLKEKGIKVVLLQPPELYEATERIQHAAELSALAQEIARAQGVPLITTPEVGSPFTTNRANFADVLHVSPTGADAYTAQLWPALQAARSR